MVQARVLRRGIIPARAGFTSRSRTTSSSVRDHPRSRGVYCRPRRWRPLSTGSSPLARGLRSAPEMILGVRRIIPARAGFTYSLSSCVRRIADHPRSRGVYRTARTRSPSGRGSSPLARGLQPPARGFGAAPGIIPARAGFTSSRRSPTPGGWDHPRSRGVYAPRRHWWHQRGGSSPLARGLPLSMNETIVEAGIIPARAGFTRQPARRPRWPLDHPRSRGVYALMNSLPGSGFGSSPLARGLRRLAQPAWASPRIIPARAGFTLRGGRCCSRARDHLRSRGVYGGLHRGETGAVGSSPLARGLPRARCKPRWRSRIIPARAGFTRRSTARTRACTDHPRSRGVYLRS